MFRSVDDLFKQICFRSFTTTVSSFFPYLCLKSSKMSIILYFFEGIDLVICFNVDRILWFSFYIRINVRQDNGEYIKNHHLLTGGFIIHSGLHTFLGSFINYSGSTIVVQSNGSISLPVYSFSATRTPKLSAAVVRYTPLRESPKLITLALTISLGLKHQIITTESIIFSLTFSFRMAPSNALPSLLRHDTLLTCNIQTIHSSSLTFNTLPNTTSPMAKPTRLMGKLLLI